MNILWLCNIKLPIIAEMQGQSHSPYGGWLDQLSRYLLEQGHYLTVLYPSSVQEQGRQENLVYRGFTSDNLRKSFSEVIHVENPDVIHIWGTEFAHSLAMTDVLESLGQGDRAVISIQGLVSIISMHYSLNLPYRVVHGYTLRDLVRRNNIYHQILSFKKRGEAEIEALRSVKHIIGRTNWDKACAKQINPEAAYHHCGEILRSSFYNAKWSLENCERYSIFVSQASYPVKGFHILLEAMREIVKYYPQARIYAAGHNPTYLGEPLKIRLRRTYYGKYLVSLIRKHGLENNVVFTGPLNEEEMCGRYLKSHVFVSPSTIENSPNSLGEAMLLGMPCVSSYVGGVSSMLIHGKEGYLYQHDAPYMLAWYIQQLFSNDDTAIALGRAARAHALNTHDRKKNLSDLLNIYKGMLKNEYRPHRPERTI